MGAYSPSPIASGYVKISDTSVSPAEGSTHVEEPHPPSNPGFPR
jgi:hypothetical protein